MERSKDYNYSFFRFSWSTNKIWFQLSFRLTFVLKHGLSLHNLCHFFSSAFMLLTNSSPKNLHVYFKVLIFCSRWLMSLWSNSFWICCSFMSFFYVFSFFFGISVVLEVRLLAIIWSLTRRWAIIDSWLMLASTRFLYILNPRSTEAYPWLKVRIVSKSWNVPCIYQ